MNHIILAYYILLHYLMLYYIILCLHPCEPHNKSPVLVKAPRRSFWTRSLKGLCDVRICSRLQKVGISQYCMAYDYMAQCSMVYYSRLQKVRRWMQDDLCRCCLVLWYGVRRTAMFQLRGFHCKEAGITVIKHEVPQA